VAFSDQATALVYGSHGDFGSYWSLAQSGFDTEPAKKAVANKLEIVRELLGDDDKPIAKMKLGDEASVRVRVRALDGFVSNLAIVDLLPAGFEVVMQASPAGESGGAEAAEGDEGGSAEGNEGGEGNEAEEGGEGGESEGGEEGRESEEGDVGGGNRSPNLLGIALPGSDFALDYVDVREDRVVLYGSAGKAMSTFLYKIKATNAGKVVAPAIHAESMYDRGVSARGEPGVVIVTRP
jgi:uncharacterized protein YfaS (alpha-2-macroglobulin family)